MPSAKVSPKRKNAAWTMPMPLPGVCEKHTHGAQSALITQLSVFIHRLRFESEKFPANNSVLWILIKSHGNAFLIRVPKMKPNEDEEMSNYANKLWTWGDKSEILSCQHVVVHLSKLGITHKRKEKSKNKKHLWLFAENRIRQFADELVDLNCS